MDEISERALTLAAAVHDGARAPREALAPYRTALDARLPRNRLLSARWRLVAAAAATQRHARSSSSTIRHSRQSRPRQRACWPNSSRLEQTWQTA